MIECNIFSISLDGRHQAAPTPTTLFCPFGLVSTEVRRRMWPHRQKVVCRESGAENTLVANNQIAYCIGAERTVNEFGTVRFIWCFSHFENHSAKRTFWQRRRDFYAKACMWKEAENHNWMRGEWVILKLINSWGNALPLLFSFPDSF